MKRPVVLFVIIAALALSLAGCGKHPTSEIKTPANEPQVTDDAQSPAEADGQAAPSEETAKLEDDTGRQDGERFEDVIILEGMEETVKYEHIRNYTLGFALDYDYESFVRRSEPDRECFISIWDAPENPENYLEVAYSPEDAETVAAAVGEALSNDYDIIKETITLDRAGTCIRIDASNAKGNGGTPDLLQAVYIIPAHDGSRVATAHYSFESAEGFGRRFSYIINTLLVIDRSGEKRLSDEQALSAIRSYCYSSNPELEGIVKAGTYPVYWDISSSDEQEIVVLFRSYTAAQSLYHIDRITGDTYVTVFVPGTMPEEKRTDESLNVWEYLS